MTVDGTSSNVTISRTYVDTGGYETNGNLAAVRIAAGASHINLASDLIAAAGVVATGVEGSLTGVCFENNVLEDTYAKLGSYTVSITATDGSGDTVSNSVSGVETAGSEYTAYGPARILDARHGTGAAAGATVALPSTSNLNFKTGQNVPNLVVVLAAPTA